MAHHSVLFLYILVLLHDSLTSQQYFANPRTAIIDAVPSDDTITSDERGNHVVVEDSSETCPESNFADTPTSENQQLTDFLSPNHQPPNPEPYLRAMFHNGHYYPYSAFNAYKNMYQVVPQDELAKRRDLNHNDVWYSYTNPSIYTSVPYSTVPPVKSLPPVYARLYGTSWPREQEWFPNQIRRQRRLHDDDDVLKQLEYDSIMKNILPTMSIPLPRDSIQNPQSPGIPYSYAAFPYGTSDCALPILLGCTPKITYGNMVNQKLAAVPYTHEYRNLLESNKINDHVDISGDKVEKNH